MSVTLPDGFMLALIHGDPLPTDVAGRVHFGCTLERPYAARAMRDRLRDAGVHEIEWEDTEAEDGYVVELYYNVN